MALAVAAESLAGAVALVGAGASILVLLVKVAAVALVPAAAVPAQADQHSHKIFVCTCCRHIPFLQTESEVGLLVIAMSRTRTESQLSCIAQPFTQSKSDLGILCDVQRASLYVAVCRQFGIA